MKSHTGSPREKSLIFRVGQEARRSRGGCAACERLVSGSTPNEITSCQTTSRSWCTCSVFERVRIGFKHVSERGNVINVPRPMAAAREKPWGFPHFVLSRNCVEKICRWGYYTPTPPRCSGTLITFCRAGCKANASRLLKAAKFFAPLTTTGNSK